MLASGRPRASSHRSAAQPEPPPGATFARGQTNRKFPARPIRPKLPIRPVQVAAGAARALARCEGPRVVASLAGSDKGGSASGISSSERPSAIWPMIAATVNREFRPVLSHERTMQVPCGRNEPQGCRAEPVLGSPHIMGHLEVGERVRKGAQVCDSSQIENVVGSSCYRNLGHA